MATLRQGITARVTAITSQIEAIKTKAKEDIAPLQRALEEENARLVRFAPWLDMSLNDIKSELGSGLDAYASEIAAK